MLQATDSPLQVQEEVGALLIWYLAVGFIRLGSALLGFAYSRSSCSLYSGSKRWKRGVSS